MIPTEDANRMLKEAGERYPVTDQQNSFACHYASIPNGMKAVRDAGYNHSTAGSQSSAAYRMLKMPRIQKLIEHYKSRLAGT